MWVAGLAIADVEVAFHDNVQQAVKSPFRMNAICVCALNTSKDKV
jgi:hypothetical protein